MEPRAADAPPESLVALLDQLRPYAEPAPVSMAPATAGWAVVAALLLVALVAAVLLWLRHRRATAWRRAALAELRALAPGLEAGDPVALAGLQALLRRVALATDARSAVADLTGAAWAGYLDRTGGAFGPLAAALADAPYRPVAGYDGRAALATAGRWIRGRHA